jgi:general stress protein YciG
MADTGTKGKQGFASMDPETAREIRRLGGLAVQRRGKAHRLTQEEARKGGLTAQRRGKAHRLTQEEARKGGKTSQPNSRRQRAKAKDRNGKE